MPDLVWRALWTAVIIAAGWGALRVLTQQAARRGAARLSELRPAGHAGKVLVYFTTPACIPCKTIQRPAIEAAKQNLGTELEVIEIDAQAQPELASRWGVLSVPTTYLFNRDGEMKHANYGVARLEKLLEQLRQL